MRPLVDGGLCEIPWTGHWQRTMRSRGNRKRAKYIRVNYKMNSVQVSQRNNFIKRRLSRYWCNDILLHGFELLMHDRYRFLINIFYDWQVISCIIAFLLIIIGLRKEITANLILYIFKMSKCLGIFTHDIYIFIFYRVITIYRCFYRNTCRIYVYNFFAILI